MDQPIHHRRHYVSLAQEWTLHHGVLQYTVCRRHGALADVIRCGAYGLHSL